MLARRPVINSIAPGSPLRRAFSLVSAVRFSGADQFPSSSPELRSHKSGYRPAEDLDLRVADFSAQLRRERFSLVLGAERRSGLVHLKALVNEVINRGPVHSSGLGALILSNSIEQSIEIYREIKLLRAERELRVSRLGSVSYVAPQIDLDADRASHAEASRANLRRIAEEERLDILIATPGQLASLPRSSRVFKPQILLVEDFELQFQKKSSNEVDDILESIGLETHIVWASRNLTPVLPSYLTEWFAELDFIQQGVKVPAIRTKYFRVERNHKLTKALEILRQNKGKKGVLVCRDAEEAALLRQVVSRQQIRNFLLTTSKRALPRVWNLLSFKSSTSSLLITEPRAMRSLDLADADFAVFLADCNTPLDEYYALRALNEDAQVFKFIEI